MAVGRSYGDRVPEPGLAGSGAWWRRHFFSGPASTAVTLVLVGLLVWLLPSLLNWAVVEAVFASADGGACAAAAGACWAVLGEKGRLILFGLYPYEEQWRGVLVMAILAALILSSTVPRLWSWRLLVAWAIGLGAATALQFGGFWGLSHVPTERWGGVPMTLLLFVATVGGGVPLAVLLALGRRSRLPVIRVLATGWIEGVRGIPLVNVLFFATVLLPLFLPEGTNFDKLLRAQLAMMVFFAAYAAEAVRGGLQAIPDGQHDAAAALGLGYWSSIWTVILPQAMRIALPALIGEVIRAFKNTSLLLIIGILDVLGAAKTALVDPLWTRYFVEVYIFVGLIYFVCCFSLSQYAGKLEHCRNRGVQR